MAEKRLQSYLLPLRFLPEEKKRLREAALIDKDKSVTVWARDLIRDRATEILKDGFSVVLQKEKRKTAAKKPTKKAARGKKGANPKDP